MNFFSKNRFIYWLLIFLVVVLLSALITLLVFYSDNPDGAGKQQPLNKGKRFQKELSLSPTQADSVEGILAQYRISTGTLAADLTNYRTQLLDELAMDNPDTTIINKYIDEICGIQKKMQKASVCQYMALKEVCNPVQCQKLSALYFELYGCQGQCKRMDKGNGMMHRNRRGNPQH